jgi:hypothetical protein
MAAALLALLLQADPSLDPVLTALRATGEASYRYQVGGRFERSGEYEPGPLLVSRMKAYQSVRHKDLMLVKGPEGLWRTPEERLGEKVEKPDPDAADMVRTLQGAEAPHRLIEALLAEASKAQPADERDVDGIPCLRYLVSYRNEALKESLKKAIDRSVERKTLERPDEVRWASSMKGSLRIYIHKAEKRLLKAVDERSVKLAYKVPDGQPEVKSYKTEMEVVVSDWGRARAEFPAELRERLGLK